MQDSVYTDNYRDKLLDWHSFIDYVFLIHCDVVSYFYCFLFVCITVTKYTLFNKILGRLFSG